MPVPMEQLPKSLSALFAFVESYLCSSGMVPTPGWHRIESSCLLVYLVVMHVAIWVSCVGAEFA